jgi:hypothetical protein
LACTLRRQQGVTTPAVRGEETKLFCLFTTSAVRGEQTKLFRLLITSAVHGEQTKLFRLFTTSAIRGEQSELFHLFTTSAVRGEQTKLFCLFRTSAVRGEQTKLFRLFTTSAVRGEQSELFQLFDILNKVRQVSFEYSTMTPNKKSSPYLRQYASLIHEVGDYLRLSTGRTPSFVSSCAYCTSQKPQPLPSCKTKPVCELYSTAYCTSPTLQLLTSCKAKPVSYTALLTVQVIRIRRRICTSAPRYFQPAASKAETLERLTHAETRAPCSVASAYPDYTRT